MRDYVEVVLDKPRKLKFKMRTLREAEHFLEHKFIHYFLSPEARRAIGADSSPGVDLAAEDLKLLDQLADDAPDSERIHILGRERFEKLTRDGFRLFEFYGHNEILVLFWAGLLHEDPKLTQRQAEDLIEQYVEGPSDFHKFTKIVRWVVQAGSLYFGGGREKKTDESLAQTSTSNGTGTNSGG